MTKKERLIEIAQAASLTDAQKAYIAEQAAKAGIPFSPNTSRCLDCYKDMAVVLWSAECRKEALKDSERQYILRPGIDVRFKGQRVNDTLSDAEFAALVENKFPTEFFLKMPNNESAE